MHDFYSLLIRYNSTYLFCKCVINFSMQALAEWIVFTTSGISSGLYHACDVGTWCALSFNVLQVKVYFFFYTYGCGFGGTLVFKLSKYFC